MKKSFLMISLFLLVVLLSGCTINEPKENINDLAIKYFEDKYDTKCVYNSPYGNSMSGTHSLIISCDIIDDLIYVEVENYRSDNPVYRDNYIALKYQDEIEEFIKNYFDGTLKDTKIFYKVSDTALSSTISSNAEFSEYLKDTDIFISLDVSVSKTNYNKAGEAKIIQMLEKLSKEFNSGNNININITLAVLDDKLYKTVNEKKDIEDVLVTNKYLHRYDLIIDDSNNINEIMKDNKIVS